MTEYECKNPDCTEVFTHAEAAKNLIGTSIEISCPFCADKRHGIEEIKPLHIRSAERERKERREALLEIARGITSAQRSAS